MTKRLIVNADDYGRTPGVSAGIRQAHLRGIVTSTTTLMNMPGVEGALHQAMLECPHLGLGVHLVLTSGAPVLPVEMVPSLTGGSPVFPGVDEQIGRMSTFDLAEIRAEWHAQLERFVAVMGRPPDHLDSHHHFSYFNAVLFRIMLELASEYHCPIRLPIPARTPDTTNGLPDEVYLQALEFAPPLLQEFKPCHPDLFEASFYDETATTESLLRILSELPEGVTELMCHPGYADEMPLSGTAEVTGSVYNLQREIELDVLTHPAVFDILAAQGIERLTFQGL